MFKIAICDDETKETKSIKKLVEEFLNEYAIIYDICIFLSGEELLLSEEKFDFIFLDISMGGINGIETGMQLYQKNRKIKIVYITTFQEYCNDAINHAHAFAYLAKPIKKEKLREQVNELVKIIGIERGREIEIELLNVTEIDGGKRKEYLSLKMPVSSILYFEYIKAGRKIKVKTEKKTYEYISTMSEIEKKMELYEFRQCYRGVLVNYEHVVKAKGDKVYLNTGEILPLSQKRVTEFKEQLNKYVHRSVE